MTGAKMESRLVFSLSSRQTRMHVVQRKQKAFWHGFNHYDEDCSPRTEGGTAEPLALHVLSLRANGSSTNLQVLGHVEDARQLGLVVLLPSHVPLCH